MHGAWLGSCSEPDTRGQLTPAVRSHDGLDDEENGFFMARVQEHVAGVVRAVPEATRRPAQPTVSVVIPTLNEAANLPFVIPRIPSFVDEIIIVDGLSTDDTIAVARSYGPKVRVVVHEQRGKGAALLAGFAASSGDVIVMMDADGSTDPLEIPAYVGTLVAGADVAVGSRFIQGGGTDDMEAHRKLGNWVLTRLVRVTFGGRYSDLCYGFTAFWRDQLPRIGTDFSGFEVETAIHVRAVLHGLRVAEVPSFESPRINGSSNLNAFRDGFRILGWLGREWLRVRRAKR